MDVTNSILAANENHRNPEPMSKSSFVVYASACARISLCKISDEKTRSSDLGDDFVIYLVIVILLVDANGSVSSIFDGWRYALIVGVLHRVVEPHGYEGLF